MSEVLTDLSPEVEVLLMPPVPVVSVPAPERVTVPVARVVNARPLMARLAARTGWKFRTELKEPMSPVMLFAGAVPPQFAAVAKSVPTSAQVRVTARAGVP